MTTTTYETAGGIRVHRTVDEIPFANAIEPVVQALDAHRGVLLASSYEYPGRYKRWDMGFVDPPLALTARNRDFRVQALNPRGRVLLAPILDTLRSLDAVERVSAAEDSLEGVIRAPAGPVRARPSSTPPRALEAVERVPAAEDSLEGVIRAPAGRFVEEERSRQP